MDDIVAVALFRHGMTRENRRKAYCGWSDPPLLDETTLLPVNNREAYSQCYSSDLKRCIQTAQLLFPHLQPFERTDLREMHFGEWEGRTYEDLKDDPKYRNWVDDPEKTSPPGGERFHEFTTRIHTAWKTVTQQRPSGKIAIVTHAGVIRALLETYAPIHRPFWTWKPDYGTGYELVFTRNQLRRGDRCTLLREVPLTGNGNG